MESERADGSSASVPSLSIDVQGGRDLYVGSTLNQQQTGGVRIGDNAQITAALITGGDVTGAVNIYTIQVTAAQAAALARAPLDTAVPPACPYPGMLPFRPEDARFFLGRGQEIADLLLRLRSQRVLLLIGASGSGKSSLIFAGLLPQLALSSYWPPAYWHVLTMRPGADPVDRLATLFAGDVADPSVRLGAILRANPPAQSILLVVDQFEETFALADRPRQLAFLAALRAFQACAQLTLLLVMRADFFADLIATDLWPLLQPTQYVVGLLEGAALDQAIRQPAAQVGVAIDAALVERLRADAASEPGSLPLLQETLVLLWGQMQDRALTLADYAALGRDGRSGLAVALALKADAAYFALDPNQQAIARRIFLRLVQFGEGRADTRRQQMVAQLRARADDPAAFAVTLAYLADHRLLTLGGTVTGPAQTVDLAHEALISAWPRLRTWLVERGTAEQDRRRFEAKAQEWIRLGHGISGLLDEGELPEVETWLAGPDASDLGYDAALSDLVAASRQGLMTAQQQRVNLEAQRASAQALAVRRARWLAGLGIALVLVLGGLLARPMVLKMMARGAVRPIETSRAVFGPAFGLPPMQAISATATITAFWIEQYEVSNRQYCLCAEAGACPRRPVCDNLTTPDATDLPIAGVSVQEADAYCHWLDRRLPTEYEWERAARGSVGASWPWGEDPLTAERVNTLPTGLTTAGPAPVTSYLAGHSGEGVLNLIGNVREWTASYDNRTYPHMDRQKTWHGAPEPLDAEATLILRGGGWNDVVNTVGVRYRIGPLEHPPVSAGIRCAADRP